jgi:histidine triad (HIT) family protein
MTCDICDAVRSRKGLLFEDDKIAAFIRSKPVAPGHIIVAPKSHFPIFENVPDDISARLFIAANKLSTATFDAFGASGTNILVNNGTPAGQVEPHFMVHVIPRKDKDGLSIEWQAQKMDEQKLKDMVEKFVVKEKEEPMTPEITDNSEENYLLKSLSRVP